MESKKSNGFFGSKSYSTSSKKKTSIFGKMVSSVKSALKGNKDKYNLIDFELKVYQSIRKTKIFESRRTRIEVLEYLFVSTTLKITFFETNENNKTLYFY